MYLCFLKDREEMSHFDLKSTRIVLSIYHTKLCSFQIQFLGNVSLTYLLVCTFISSTLCAYTHWSDLFTRKVVEEENSSPKWFPLSSRKWVLKEYVFPSSESFVDTYAFCLLLYFLSTVVLLRSLQISLTTFIFIC